MSRAGGNISFLSAPRGVLEIGSSLLLPCGVALLLALTMEMKLAYRLALLFGFVGLSGFSLLPDKRIALLVGWVLLHPLSVEKVFGVAGPIYKDFVPQNIVISSADLAIWLLVLVLLFESLRGHRSVFVWPRLATPYACFIGWSIISMGFAGPTATSLLDILTMLRILVFMVVCASSLRSRNEMIVLLLALAFAVFLQVALASASVILQQPISFTVLLGQEHEMLGFSGREAGEMNIRAVGTLGHVNQQAAFHVCFTLMLLACFGLRNRLVQAVGAVIVVGSSVVLLLTFSRAGWLAYALALLVSFAAAWRAGLLGARSALVLAFGVIVGTVVLGVFADKIIDRVFFGDEGSTGSRMRMVSLALDLTAKQPFTGVGPGEFARASMFYYPPGFLENEWLEPGQTPTVPREGRMEMAWIQSEEEEKMLGVPLPVHNKYLLVLAETGIVGLALFIWFLWRLGQAPWRLLHSEDPFRKWLGVGGMGTLTGLICYLPLDLFTDTKSLLTVLAVSIFIASVPQCSQTTM